MDRISDIFASKKPLVVFTTAGYPDPVRSEEGIAAAIENGADIIELGVPFSDPMADGPVIAAASQQTAERGGRQEAAAQAEEHRKAQRGQEGG